MTNRGASRATSSQHPRWTFQVSHAFDQAHARAKELTCHWRVSKRRPDPASEGYRKVSPMLRDAHEEQTNLNNDKQYQKPVFVQTMVKDMTFEIESVAQRTASYLQESHTLVVDQQQQLEAEQQQQLAMKKERRKTTIPPHRFEEDRASSSADAPSALTIPTRTLSLSFKPVAFELDEIDLELELQKEWDAKVVTRQKQSSPTTKTIYPQQRLATGKSCLKQASSHASSNILKKSVRFDIENEIGSSPRHSSVSLLDQQGLERSGSYQKYMKLKQNMVKLDMSLDEFRRMRVFESEDDGRLLEEMQSLMTMFAAE
ncbi:hypothetical protein BJ741DRAFT_593600 [Chytriomyces cf. hyalinus JEL632]|nr:hypothetical protein BJ741DRAFT_593600 [Chytriomyces cf. hyalinus JEL632]